MSEYQYYEKSGSLIFKFTSQEEGGGEWVEGGGVLSSILPVRAELAQGDLRSLYVGWLLCAQEGELSDDELEPPLPPNLGELSRGLSKLVEFLRVDPDLLTVAAHASANTKSNRAAREEMSSWVSSLDPTEKDRVLLRLLDGESAPIAMELRARFNRYRAEHEPITELRQRTVGELLAAAEAQTEKRRRDETKKAVRAKAQQERLAAAAREKHLNSLSGRESELWAEVESLAATAQSKAYDLALRHLIDLRDLAARQATEADFGKRLAALREAYARKRAWISRLRQVEV